MQRNLIIALCTAVLWMGASSAGAITYKGDLETEESVAFPEQTAPPASPPAGQRKLYFKDDGGLYQLDSSGNENPVIHSGFKNALINGGFRIWQRGTSFTSTGYTADRWRITPGSGAAFSTTRQTFAAGQTAVPGNPQYMVSLDRTTAGTATSVFSQRIENVRTFSGETVTVSFWARADAAGFDITTDFNQNFGTGGSPSSPVQTTSKTHALTTSWQQFTHTVEMPSISGKTLGANSDHYVELRFLWNEAQGATDKIFMARVQVEKGSVATELERRPIGTELQLAKRYYEILSKGQINGVFISSSKVTVGGSYHVEKRATPTATLLDTSPTFLEAGVNNRTGSSSAITASRPALQAGYFDIDGFSGATAGNGAFAGSVDIIGLDAEL